MNETKRAQQVWRNAQAALIAASEKLLFVSAEEHDEAVEEYLDAEAVVVEAKKYYDRLRSESQEQVVMYQPKAG